MSYPIIDDLDCLGSFLLAAKKYEMQFILDSNKGIFKDHEFIQRDPLHLYSIACACGFEDQAKYVARNAEHLTVIRRANAGNLEGLTVISYHRLVCFLAERDNMWHENLSKSPIKGCNCDDGSIRSLYNGIKESLKRPSRRPENIYLEALEVRSRFIKQGCACGTNCLMRDHQIDSFVKEMVQEGETLCDKFMW